MKKSENLKMHEIMKKNNAYKNRLGVYNIRNISIIIFLFHILSLSACKKEEVKWDTTHPVVETGPTQYGIPFSNVPNTSDIILYEVNFYAFSPQRNLEGVRLKLDSLENLGVNTIWLMPVYPIGEEKAIGSPYAVKDYMSVNPDFGTLDDLRLLVEEAHDRDMAVILDWVANHTAWDNAWIKNKSWYTQDGGGNIISANGWTDVADLNFSNSDMRKEMIKAMKYWILEANVDGFRCDYADGVPMDFWSQAIDTLKKIPERKLILFAEGTSKELFNAGFDLTFGWAFYGQLKEIFNTNKSVQGLLNVNITDYSGVPEGSHILRFTSNHDDDAWDDTPLEIFKSMEGSMAAFVLTSYLGGVPLIYNGQEVGCPVKLGFFSNSYTSINWNLNPGLKSQYKSIIEFRKSSDAVKNGTVESLDANTDVISIKRKSGTEEVIVIVNVRNSLKEYQVPASLANTIWKNALTGETINMANGLQLDPYSYYILKK